MALPRLIWCFLAAAMHPLLGVAALTAGEPCHTAPCAAPAVEVVNTPPAKIVVNVPPPEVVYQDSSGEVLKPRGGLFCRRPFGKSCQTIPAPTTQTIATLVSPVSTSFSSLGLLGAQGLNAGAAHFAVAGGPAMIPMAANPALFQQTACAQSEQVAAFEGLRAIHAAEVRTAAIVASRAQQDAELGAMVAALDRAKGSMAAVASSRNGPAASASASTAASQAVAAATATAATASALARQLDAIQARLDAIEKQVNVLTKTQEAIIDRLTKEKPEK